MRLALMLFLGALLAGCGGTDPEPLQARIDSLETVNQDLRAQIAQMQPAEAQRGPAGQTLQPAIRFPSGSAWLTTRARRSLDSLASVLQRDYPDREFRIRGFTDSMPIGPSLQDVYPSNWYLSAQRAAAVAHYLDQNYDLRRPRLEIGAFGPQNPVASNDTPEGRRQNRRVEIVVDERPPEPGA
jgi:chemotaxis protein MotB